jgi:peptide/nickel transport system substrate-binding protein
MKKISKVTVVAVALALMSGVTACSGSGSTSDPAAKRPLRIGQTYSLYQYWHDPASIAASGGAISTELGIAYGALFHQLPDGKIAEQLATSWHYVDSGARTNQDFEFTLRKDVKFSDGTPLDAAAVVGWFNHMYQQHTGASPGFSNLLGPDPTFAAVDQWTVSMKLTVPTPNLPSLLSDGGFIWGLIASPKCVADPTLFNQQTCGTGQFMLDSARTVAGDHYTYVPNPYYYAATDVTFTEVTVKVIPVATSMLQALQAGQLDLAAAGNDPSTAKAAESSGFAVNWATNGAWVLLLHANGKPAEAAALADVRVRQAMSYALDRKAIADATGFGYSQPYSEVPSTDATDPQYTNYYPYDPDKAKALLAAAGFGQGLKFTIHLTAQQAQYFPVVAKYLDAVGIHVVYETLNSNNTASAFASDPMNFFGQGFAPTPPTYQLWLSPSSAVNVVGSDDQVNQFYDQGLKSADPAPSWKQLWGRVTTQAYFVVINTYPILYYSSKSLGGVNVTTQRLGSPLVTEMSPK